MTLIAVGLLDDGERGVASAIVKSHEIYHEN